MSEPILSHLQYAVLSCLGSNEITGKELRAALKSEKGILKSGPAFYQLMARMEEAKFVEGRYDQFELDGKKVRQRKYKITGHGVRAQTDAELFYRSGVSNAKLTGV